MKIPHKAISDRRSRIRGHQMIEFSAALTILVLAILLPLINFSIIPVRYGMLQSQVDSKVHKLAQLSKLSDAFTACNSIADQTDPIMKMSGCKSEVFNSQLCIASMSRADRTAYIDGAATIPIKFLPQGEYSPCDYTLVLKANVEIAPLVLAPFFGLKIPGVTEPVACQITRSAQWENMGRDPVTGEFFINE